MIEVIPTNTCPPDIAELSRRSAEFAAFARSVQLDVGDGAFVPALSWPYGAGQLSELTDLPQADRLRYEIHLMVNAPADIGARFARAGAHRILGHVEVFHTASEAKAALASWRSAGADEAGLAVLLETPLSVLEPLLQNIDVVQLMSIAKLGYQGAPFEPKIYDRIQELHRIRPDLPIEVDGGVGESNIAKLAEAGATRFGVGSAISKASDPKAAYERLKTLAENAIQ